MAARTIAIKITLENTEAIRRSKIQVQASKELEASFKRMEGAAGALQASVRGLEVPMRKVSQLQQGLTSSFIKGNLAARAISVAYIGITSAIGGAVSEAVAFDFALGKLTVLNTEGAGAFNTLKKSIEDVALTTTATIGEVGEAALVMRKLGLSSQDTSNALKGIVTVSTTLDEDLNQVAKSVTQVMNVFGVAGSDADKITEKLFKAVKSSALTLEDFGVAFSYAGASAKQAGVSFDELLAVMTVLSQNGIRASTIGTQLRRVFTELSSPTTNAAQSLGGMTVEFMGLANAMKMIDEDGLDLESVKDKFGRTATSVVQILRENSDKIIDATSALKLYREELAAAAKEMQDNTITGRIENMTGAFSAFASTLTQEAKPALLNFFRVITGAVQGLNEAISDGSIKYKSMATIIGGGIANQFKDKESQNIQQDPFSGAPMVFTDSGIYEYFTDMEKKTEETRLRVARDIGMINTMLQNMGELSGGIKPEPGEPDLSIGNYDTMALKLADKEGLASLKEFDEVMKEIGKDIDKVFKQAKTDVKLMDYELETERLQKLNSMAMTLSQTIGQTLVASVDMFSNSLANALVEMDGSLLKWGDMFKSVLKMLLAEMIKVIIRMLIIKAIASALGGGAAGGIVTGVPANTMGGSFLQGMGATLRAGGREEMVRKPTLFMAGEAGPERVSFKPKGDNSSGGNTVFEIHGDVYDYDAFNRRVKKAMAENRKSYV